MKEIFFATVSILLIAAVLIQQKNSSMGSLMGGDSGDEMVQTRRGAEKVMHYITIVLALALFGGAAGVLVMA